MVGLTHPRQLVAWFLRSRKLGFAASGTPPKEGSDISKLDLMLTTDESTNQFIFCGGGGPSKSGLIPTTIHPVGRRDPYSSARGQHESVVGMKKGAMSESAISSPTRTKSCDVCCRTLMALHGAPFSSFNTSHGIRIGQPPAPKPQRMDAVFFSS